MKKSSRILSSMMTYMVMFSSFVKNKFSSKEKSTFVLPSEKERAKTRQERLEMWYKNKGVLQWSFGDDVVWARNKKNAIRKAKNKGIPDDVIDATFAEKAVVKTQTV